jgi:hypothetical protein
VQLSRLGIWLSAIGFVGVFTTVELIARLPSPWGLIPVTFFAITAFGAVAEDHELPIRERRLLRTMIGAGWSSLVLADLGLYLFPDHPPYGLGLLVLASPLVCLTYRSVREELALWFARITTPTQ